MASRTWTDEQLIAAVQSSTSFMAVSVKLGLSTYGSNSRTIQKRTKELGLDTKHFLSKWESLAQARSLNTSALSHAELFVEQSRCRKNLKRVILRDNLLTYKCAECGIDSWNGKEIALHLDHISGDGNDNRLGNLRFLCPNCHSQTDTYCGRKLRAITRSNRTCLDCGVSVSSSAKRCVQCAAIVKNQPKIDWLPMETLVPMVAELGYSETARRLGVSANGVKRHIRRHS
jgi:Zn finger protein HypA/HybF involved in hydrogenase expression